MVSYLAEKRPGGLYGRERADRQGCRRRAHRQKSQSRILPQKGGDHRRRHHPLFRPEIFSGVVIGMKMRDKNIIYIFYRDSCLSHSLTKVRKRSRPSRIEEEHSGFTLDQICICLGIMKFVYHQIKFFKQL